jgi:transcriptional regulator with XRE-family HTH domain
MSASHPTLGKILRALRAREGWTLNQMSEKSGVPVSTLSKIEHDRLSLTYDKLVQLCQKLGIRMSELFAESADPAEQPITARRSIGELKDALRVETDHYDYYYLCTELRRKRMIPVVTRVRAKTAEEFGDLLRHPGEEFIYVLEGSVEVHTEFYDPVLLRAGNSIYIDSTMGHAYLAAEGCEEAVLLGVVSSAEDDLMRSLLTLHGEADATPEPSGRGSQAASLRKPATRGR